ncbi:hypothetical protein CW362_31155 [Streptomyces populi]|uniref:Histidine kinase/HSP90-like ATPase domain-containing protein n=1 Tax=Streptomyces populi TaxID=2058924 RepID=A0A2I0SGR7_9ACTN|nr:hypothetical protein CW362_31155 [Streptomyces populi]
MPFLFTVRDALSIPVADPAVEIVKLIVSELVTNACTYAAGPALLQLQVAGNAPASNGGTAIPCRPP